jgi:hypothetical protein
MADHQRQIIAIAKRHGFVLHRRSKHLVFRLPGGRAQVVTGKTLSCHRAIANIEAQFRNAAVAP